jgi:hypothetical protein
MTIRKNIFIGEVDLFQSELNEKQPKKLQETGNESQEIDKRSKLALNGAVAGLSYNTIIYRRKSQVGQYLVRMARAGTPYCC